jgi:Flp pilus assembly pilin Flp
LGRVVHDSGATAVEQGLVAALIALVIIVGVSALDALVNRAWVKGCSTVKWLFEVIFLTPFRRSTRSSCDCPAVA